MIGGDRKVTRQEELVTAIQNIGVVISVCGFLCFGMSANDFTALFFFVVAVIGIIVTIVCQVILDKLKKNKGQHRQAHDLYH